MLEYEYIIGQNLEKKWGRMNFKRFRELLPTRFTIVIDSKSYHSRTIDKGGRVWLGINAFDYFKTGDTLLISIDNDRVYIRKKP